MSWIDVDRKGLAKLLERRGKAWILAELVQNAWDAPGVTRVDVRLSPIDGKPLAELTVTDDSPAGFADLAHAFTLFAESTKKADPTLRGRFNAGEKMVLALCERATIATTKGTLEFSPDDGRQQFPRRKRAAGTEFRATLRITRDDVAEILTEAKTFIGPHQVDTTINGSPIARRTQLRAFDCTLPTDVAGADGVLRRARRKTTVHLYPPPPDRPARLYELGIPIIETGDRFDVDVAQKVPLTLERDNVPPSYLRELRAGVLNHAADLLAGDDTAATWIGDAIASTLAQPAAVARVITARYGQAVTYDPTDHEANHRAVAAGYAVIHGRTFSADQWDQVRASGAAPPAGKLFPTPKPFDPDGEPAVRVEPTIAMTAFARFIGTLGQRLLGRAVDVIYLERFNARAAYGDGEMCFNVSDLGGTPWFEAPLRLEQLDIVLHELAHEHAANHLSRDYADARGKLGAQATLLALEEPGIFNLARYTDT